jgi:organic hydroperoxide reductase OsmC/OhrA
MRQHHYTIDTAWTGNTGEGTKTYKGYERSHTIAAPGKQLIPGSSDPAFRGDNTRYNPEELLVAALSACHMLSYLHVCAVAGIVVVDYKDQATGTMEETSGGSGHFTEVILYPVVTITDATRVDEANQLHHKAHALCFIANSCNFPVKHQAVCNVRGL